MIQLLITNKTLHRDCKGLATFLATRLEKGLKGFALASGKKFGIELVLLHYALLLVQKIRTTSTN